MKLKFAKRFAAKFPALRLITLKRPLPRSRGAARAAIASISERLKLTGPVTFAQALFDNAGATGAPCASSRYLAMEMAKAAPVGGDGVVVEVGAGTGAITKALIARGIDAERLLIIERSPLLFAHLKREFPTLRVVYGDAADVMKILPPDAKVDAVISSVPFRSLPFAISEKIADQWRSSLPSGTPIMQYTYALRGPLRHLSERFANEKETLVLRNFPPARVVRFCA